MKKNILLLGSVIVIHTILTASHEKLVEHKNQGQERPRQNELIEQRAHAHYKDSWFTERNKARYKERFKELLPDTKNLIHELEANKNGLNLETKTNDELISLKQQIAQEITEQNAKSEGLIFRDKSQHLIDDLKTIENQLQKAIENSSSITKKALTNPLTLDPAHFQSSTMSEQTASTDYPSTMAGTPTQSNTTMEEPNSSSVFTEVAKQQSEASLNESLQQFSGSARTINQENSVSSLTTQAAPFEEQDLSQLYQKTPQEQIVENTSRIKEHDQELTDITKKIAAKNAEISEIKRDKKFKNLNKTINDLIVEQNLIKTNMKKGNSQEIATKIKSLQEQKTTLLKPHETELNTLTIDKNALEKQIQELHEENDALQRQVQDRQKTSTQERITQINQTQSSKQKIEKLRILLGENPNANTREQAYTMLDQAIKELSNNSNEFQTTVKEYIEKLKNYYDTYSTSENKVATLHTLEQMILRKETEDNVRSINTDINLLNNQGISNPHLIFNKISQSLEKQQNITNKLDSEFKQESINAENQIKINLKTIGKQAYDYYTKVQQENSTQNINSIRATLQKYGISLNQADPTPKQIPAQKKVKPGLFDPNKRY